VDTGGEHASVLGGLESEWTQAENMPVFWEDLRGNGHRRRICQYSERTREKVDTGGEHASVLGGLEKKWPQVENMSVF